MPVIAEVFGNIGITKDDVDFICSGSTDYLIGGPFSFVMALDAVGVWPPRAESHVEMDGAWALYEAWVLLQEGEIDAALVYSFGRSSLGNLNEILALQLDPVLPGPAVARPGQPGRPAGPGPHRRGQGHRGRLRRHRRPQPARTPWPTPRPRWPRTCPPSTLLEDDYVVAPLRRHALPPITDGAAAIVLAAGDKAAPVVGAARCGSPASTTGWRPTRSGPAT